MLLLLENRKSAEPVDTHRVSSGQAPTGGVGDNEGEGDGESRRNEGCSRSSCVAAMIAGKAYDYASPE